MVLVLVLGWIERWVDAMVQVWVVGGLVRDLMLGSCWTLAS